MDNQVLEKFVRSGLPNLLKKKVYTKRHKKSGQATEEAPG
jgi:hypothetical protein